MIGIVIAVGIGKVRVQCAQLPGPVIHQPGKIVQGFLDRHLRPAACLPGNINGGGISGFVSRGEHYGVEQIPYPDTVPYGQAGGAAVRPDHENFFPGGDHFIRRGVLKEQQRGHDLGSTRRVETLPGVFLVERFPIGFPHQDYSFGLKLNTGVFQGLSHRGENQ